MPKASSSPASGAASAKCGPRSGKTRWARPACGSCPSLPISEDFESFKDGDTIGWWVGVSKLKYTIETRDGSKVLKKLHDDKGPIFNRSLAFITPPIPAGYTVEADVMGVKEGRRRGDVGVVNARYVLELYGGGKKLRVMSWIPGPRFEKQIDFPGPGARGTA